MTLMSVQRGTPRDAAAIRLSTYAPHVGRSVAEYAAPMPRPRTTLSKGWSLVATRAALASAPATAPIMLRRSKVFTNLAFQPGPRRAFMLDLRRATRKILYNPPGT